jgi:energy-coupling factor transport system ATP-binding protein
MEDMIKVRGLVHRYSPQTESETLALAGIDLDVRPGEFLVIIGHNGSGKSTLAKHINALLLPDEGEVWVNGLDATLPENLWRVRQTAGMVFQNPDNQIVATVVEEDVAFGPENLGVPQPEIVARVDRSLAAVGMESYRTHAPHLLSGGQKQRVAIAGILAMQPACIILDEATAMLDPGGRAEVLATVRRLNREQGITVIHITHYMDEAVEADRVLVMEEGRIVLGGTPREVFAQVDHLRELGLDVPQVTELAQQLKQAGLDVPADALTIDELVDCLCR